MWIVVDHLKFSIYLLAEAKLNKVFQTGLINTALLQCIFNRLDHSSYVVIGHLRIDR
jgi:hypothetical protein